jgi:hypothetical protein
MACGDGVTPEDKEDDSDGTVTDSDGTVTVAKKASKMV